MNINNQDLILKVLPYFILLIKWWYTLLVTILFCIMFTISHCIIVLTLLIIIHLVHKYRHQTDFLQRSRFEKRRLCQPAKRFLFIHRWGRETRANYGNYNRSKIILRDDIAKIAKMHKKSKINLHGLYWVTAYSSLLCPHLIFF